MRLLNTTTLKLEEHFDDKIPKYAILSHTWGDDEVTFGSINGPNPERKSGYKKIEYTCAQAKRDGLSYAWVDTCCIDKSSSSELSEAINSMFQWYKQSQLCYAYLVDVTSELFDRTFPRSRWFRRGWTLQELLAPHEVVFFDANWGRLGTRTDHRAQISRITGIDVHALNLHKDFRFGPDEGLATFCVAKRMSWASNRETTRVEDTAYCLLGIFNVNLPLLYGEGVKAFIRLQEEVIKRSHDESILAWDLDEEVDPEDGIPSKFAKSILGWQNEPSSVLAKSPKNFRKCHNMVRGLDAGSPFMITNLGLDIRLPLVPVYNTGIVIGRRQNPDEIQGWIGLLNCGPGTDIGLPGIALCPTVVAGQVKRIGFGSRSWRTGLVGPRGAAQAVRTKITIVEEDEMLSVGDVRFRKVIVNESRSLLDLGYRVLTASATNVMGKFQARPYEVKWDSKAKILTVNDIKVTEDLLIITFQSLQSCIDPHFTVLIRDENAIVRQGLFTKGSELQFYEFLEVHSQKDDKEDAVLRGWGQTEFQVVVTVKEDEIAVWHILEVNVDVQVNTRGLKNG
jgi:heterokaryon incompatibility protein (HET)